MKIIIIIKHCIQKMSYNKTENYDKYLTINDQTILHNESFGKIFTLRTNISQFNLNFTGKKI